VQQRSTTTSRRQQEQTMRLDWVLRAAEAVFLERGYGGAGMVEIAKRAEVALGTLYKTFPGKDDLFAGVIERRMDGFLDHVRAASTDGSPRVRLERLVRGMFDYFLQRGDLFRMYVAATHGFPWHLRSRLGERAVTGYHALVAEVEGICRLALAGRSRRTAHATALAVVGTLNAVLGDWVESPRGRSNATVASEAWAVVGRLVP
jgi:AcrR family transcriptional regulator